MINKRTYILILCFLSISYFLRAQDVGKIDSINSISRSKIISNPGKYAKIFEQNIIEAQKINYKLGEGKAYFELGAVNYMLGYYQKSTEANLQALKIFEQLDDKLLLASAYADIGYQIKRRNLQRAITLMRKGKGIAEENSFDTLLTSIYDNYGVLMEMDDQLDSAEYYYNKALNLKTRIKDSIGIPYSLNNLAGVYAMKNDFDKAFKMLKKSDEYRAKENDFYGKISNQVMYGDLFLFKGDLDSAAKYFKRVINSKNEAKNNQMIGYCYEKLTEIYQRKKNYKAALESQKKYMAYKDSLINLETNRKIAELEIEYETEKKDRMLAENKLELERRNSLLFITALVILFMLILIWGTFKYNKFKREQYKKQFEINSRMEKEKLRRKIADEKLRIARELHDNIGSQLTFMISTLDNISYIDRDDKMSKRLDHLRNFTSNTLNELRNTIWAMKNDDMTLDAMILKLNEIKSHFAEEGKFKFIFDNNLKENLSISSIKVLNLFRIAQEAIQNAIKYSEGTEIKLTLNYLNNFLHLSVEDNGKGFDVNSAINGNGLDNMKNRANKIGGELNISSGSNGTTVSLKLAI